MVYLIKDDPVQNKQRQPKHAVFVTVCLCSMHECEAEQPGIQNKGTDENENGLIKDFSITDMS